MEEKEELLPLPATEYEFMERRMAKVSPDFHVRFDNAYYSVDKAYVHQQVVVAATESVVQISSKQGKPLAEWPRAKYKGQWFTDPNHLPANFKDMAEWNSAFFIRRAMTIGPNTTEVIKRILKCRKLEVQTYRMCQGGLSFSNRYSKEALEMACESALSSGKVTYTTIKNTIAAFAEELGKNGYNTKLNNERNKGAFIMSSEASDINTLLSRSKTLASSRKEGDQ